MIKNDFEKIYARVLAYYPNWKPDAGVRQIWFEELEKYTAAKFIAAVKKIGFQNKSAFAPNLMQILAEISGDDGGEQVDIVWQDVLQKAARGLTKLPAEFSEASQYAIRAVGGLKALGLTTLDQLTWKKKEFISAYNDYNLAKKVVDIDGVEKIEANSKMFHLVKGVKSL